MPKGKAGFFGGQSPEDRRASFELQKRVQVEAESLLAELSDYVSKSGDTMTGMLTLPSTTPTDANHAARKAYVDGQDALQVSKSGDSMSGMLTLPSTTPSIDNHATRKGYVDTQVNTRVPTTRTVSAGNGLTGGGALSSNVTITMGLPGTLNGGTSNGVTSSGHTHSISSTTSRTNSSDTTLLAAAAMNNHRTSSDHDSRYVNISGGGSVTGQLVATQNGNSTTWSDMGLVSRSNGTRGGVGMEEGANRLQFRTANNIVYLRSAGDAVFRAFHAIISNQSSRTLKQDIETWSLKASNAGAMLNDSIAWSATDVVKKLRPVTYRWEEETWFDNDLGSERRNEARWRLHRYQKERGLPLYSSEETTHVCGRNCKGSSDDPCGFFKNWQRGELGFIAEEVGDVIPQVTHIDHQNGENTAIDHMGMIAVLTKAVQELTERVETLEVELRG